MALTDFVGVPLVVHWPATSKGQFWEIGENYRKTAAIRRLNVPYAAQVLTATPFLDEQTKPREYMCGAQSGALLVAEALRYAQSDPARRAAGRCKATR